MTLAEIQDRLYLGGPEYQLLLEHRGGCTCFAHPPCSACCTPLSTEEAVALGWLPDDALDPPIDYMKAVRDACR